jgi:hypothetical protein
VRVCGGFVQLCANFENQVCPKILGFLLAICAYYGVWGAAGPISAIRGVGGSLSTTLEKRPTTPAKSILEHIVQDIVSVSGNRYFINPLGGIYHGYKATTEHHALLSV